MLSAWALVACLQSLAGKGRLLYIRVGGQHPKKWAGRIAFALVQRRDYEIVADQDATWFLRGEAGGGILIDASPFGVNLKDPAVSYVLVSGSDDDPCFAARDTETPWYRARRGMPPQDMKWILETL